MTSIKPYFKYLVLTSWTIFLALNVHALAVAAKKQRQFYEMRVYRFKTPDQKKMTEDYLRSAAIPALNRLGIESVGVFDEADQKDGLKLYVFVPYKSLEQFSQVASKLATDKTYQEAAAAYLNTPNTQPAYDRIETMLMEAFVGMPTLRVPSTTAPKANRIYEFRIYESYSERAGQKKLDMFNEAGEIKIFERLGFNAVFYGKVIAGAKQPCLGYMTTFDDKASRDAHWKAFSSDPEWKKVSPLPEFANTVSHIEMHFLNPTEYSQI